MNIVISIVMFFVTLGILVFFHEGGHFLAAKALGVRVLKFSLGFGKRLIGFTAGGTDYVISLIPLGGYVKMAGEYGKEDEPAPDQYFRKPPWVRAVIALAGPVTNILLAVVFYAIVLKVGYTVYTYSNEIGYVYETLELGEKEVATPAFEAGITEGDKIVAIDGKPVTSWYDIQNEIWTSPGETLDLTVSHAGEKETVTVTTLVEPETGRGLVGFAYFQSPDVYKVFEDTAAAKIGIEPGDRLREINGEPVSDFTDFVVTVEDLPAGDYTFAFDTSSGPKSVVVNYDGGNAEGFLGELGIVFGLYEKKVQVGWLQMFPEAAKKVGESLVLTAKGIGLIFKGEVQFHKALGGPITIAAMAGETARAGWVSFLQFLAYMSVILGFLNLLPIPVLDGGQITISIVETVIRRNLPDRAREIVTIIGLALVVGLTVMALSADVTRLFTGF
ncbi:MAG: RIP metalloprotease RseP [bacterium]|nr:RIP metalloprotease RseP [bacterium]